MSEAQLRDRIEYLEAEVAMLRDELGQGKNDEHLNAARRTFVIMPQAARLLLALIDGRQRSHEALRTLLWGADGGPEGNVLQVHMTHLRKGMRPHGIEIVTIWGFGFQMSAVDCAKAKALLGIKAKP